MEIKKIEKSDFVMFPRMQHRGLQFRHVERDAYRARVFRLMKDRLAEKVEEFVENGTTKARYKKTGTVML